MISARLQPRPALRRAHDDPLAMLVGLFDCALVLALGLALMLERARAARAAPIVPDQHRTLEHYRESDQVGRGQGTRLGTAYRLDNGDVVYVPDRAAGR